MPTHRTPLTPVPAAPHESAAPQRRHPAARAHGRHRDAAEAPVARRAAPVAAPAVPGSRRDRRLQQSRTAAERTTGSRSHPAAHRLAQATLVTVLGVATVVVPLGRGEDGAAGRATAAPVAPPLEQFRALPSELTDDATPPPAVARPVQEVPADDRAERLARTEQLAAARAERRQREERRRQRDRAARAAARAPIPGCDPAHVEAGDDNGRLHTDSLCRLPWAEDEMLRADAASALARLNVAYRAEFGSSLSITDGYRTYESQVRLRSTKPGLAARPGTSEHGWAKAVDLGGGVESGGPQHAWMREHAPALGWENPDWARKGGSGPYEPWHWEYVGGS